MHIVKNAQSKTIFLLTLVLLAVLLFSPRHAEAQWPPFRLRIDPTYADGKITYDVSFRSQVDWKLSDVVINIPIPTGTRYLEATAPTSTEVKYSGTEVNFFSSLPDRGRIDATFVVEVTNPEQTEFSTKAWVAWKGEQPGDYLINDITVDTTERPTVVAWERPPQVRLDLNMDAMVKDETITYSIYVKNTRGSRSLRMWDLQVRVPIPPGTTFLSAEAPPLFATNFDGREVSFFISELSAGVDIAPLRFRVSTEGVTDPALVTHAWATWKNWSRRAGTNVIATEDTVSGNIVVQPHTNQRVVPDTTGDVQLPSYDVTNIAFQDKGDYFNALFYTAGALCPVDAEIDVFLYIDSDCRANTGDERNGRGVEYELRYSYDQQGTRLRVWDEEEKSWNRVREEFKVEAIPGSQTIAMSVPYELIGGNQQFCWVSRTRLNSDELAGLSSDWIPDGSNPRLSRFNAAMVEEADIDLSEAIAVPPPVQISDEEDSGGEEGVDSSPITTDPVVEETTGDDSSGTDTSNPENVVEETANAADGNAEESASTPQQNRRSNSTNVALDNGACAASTAETAPAPQLEMISGKLAIPLDNGSVTYDVHIFSLPEGQEIDRITNARQPNFSPDGQRLLVNRESSVQDSIYEYNLSDNTNRQVSDASEDAYPTYDPTSGRVAYGTGRTTNGSDLVRQPALYVQCSLKLPAAEDEPRCQDKSALRLEPAGQISDIEGSHPVWTSNDLIAYNGCNTWLGSSLCGIYTVPSTSGRGFSDGFIPLQRTSFTSDLPSDAKGDFIAFTSQRDGNWEAYVMRQDGSEVRNLSNSPQSSDGLPTISPDGNWVAYVSDRGGVWAVWAVSITGGESRKLFDLPNPVPWGDGDRIWQNERISWGP